MRGLLLANESSAGVRRRRDFQLRYLLPLIRLGRPQTERSSDLWLCLVTSGPLLTGGRNHHLRPSRHRAHPNKLPALSSGETWSPPSIPQTLECDLSGRCYRAVSRRDGQRCRHDVLYHASCSSHWLRLISISLLKKGSPVASKASDSGKGCGGAIPFLMQLQQTQASSPVACFENTNK